MDISAIQGGEVRRLMENAIKNIHIFWGNPSLIEYACSHNIDQVELSLSSI